jgi:hypothetical protein
VTKIEIEGDSEAAVALALLRMVAEAEGHVSPTGALQGVGKDWLLDTFAECLAAAYGEREVYEEEEDEEEDEEEEGEDEDEEDEEDERAPNS